MPYKYRPLDNSTGEIRLLYISLQDNDSEDVDGQLHCSLLHVSSQEKFPFDNGEIIYSDHSPWGEYHALSYEWAAPEPKQTVWLDNEPHLVNPNLFEALQQVRRVARTSDQQHMKLWVDAICIDQRNVQERNAQVPRMRYIYSCASTVYCHLTPYCLSILYASETGTEHERDYEADMKLASLVIPDIAKLSDHGLSNVIESLGDGVSIGQAKVWYTLLRFLNNSYWARLWIIQEIVLASKQVVILGADCRFDFEAVEQLANIIRDGSHAIFGFLSRTTDSGTIKMPSSLPHFGNIAAQRFVRKQRSEGDTRYTDVDLDLACLLPSWSSSCTNPRDRIYGFLGLMSHAQAEKVTVDYDKPMEEVYTEFMAALIDNTGSLFALE